MRTDVRMVNGRRFLPVVAPPGRLVRLGIALDQRNDARQTMRVAQMAERAGIDALWVADRYITADGYPRLEAWTVLSIAGFYTSRIRIGVMFTAGLRAAPGLGAMVGSMDTTLGGRMELGVAAGWDAAEFRALGVPFAEESARVEQMAEFGRVLLRVSSGAGRDGAKGIGVTSPQPGGPPLTMELRHPRQLGPAVEMADNVLLEAASMPKLAQMVDVVRRGCEDAGRDPETIGIAVELPVSVGRTDAESDVRVEIDDLLSQMDTKTIGMHGTLERCQDIMIELAHLGVSDVRCVLPQVPDIDDVIAQLTATAVGTKEVLKPGAERSASPEPPPGWGGPPKKGPPSAPHE